MSSNKSKARDVNDYIEAKIRDFDVEIMYYDTDNFKKKVNALATLEQERHKLLGKPISKGDAYDMIVNKIMKHVESPEFQEDNFSRSKSSSRTKTNSKSKSPQKTKSRSKSRERKTSRKTSRKTCVSQCKENCQRSLQKGPRGGQFYMKNNKKIYVASPK